MSMNMIMLTGGLPLLVAIGLLCDLCMEHNHLHVRLLSQVLSHGLACQLSLLQLVLLKVVVTTGIQ